MKQVIGAGIAAVKYANPLSFFENYKSTHLAKVKNAREDALLFQKGRYTDDVKSYPFTTTNTLLPLEDRVRLIFHESAAEKGDRYRDLLKYYKSEGVELAEAQRLAIKHTGYCPLGGYFNRSSSVVRCII